MTDWTNCTGWFSDAGLNINTDELWWLELNPRLVLTDSNKRRFVCSTEGRCLQMTHSDRTFLFDSAVSDTVKTYPFMMHWWRTVDANLIHKFDQQISPDDSSPLVFDALLGLEKPHRNFAWNWFEQNPEISKLGYITYYRRPGNKEQYHVDNDIELKNFRRTSLSFEYQGQSVVYSSIIPRNIYSHTRVSLVAETFWAQRGWSQFTEKIAKPILCRRPFVVLSNPGYLRRLKTFGFQTFDNVIDESYDEIEDDHLRWSRALEQLKIFAQMDRNDIEKTLGSRLDLNKKIMNIDWCQVFKNDLKRLAHDQYN